jgi:hypothetical protein
MYMDHHPLTVDIGDLPVQRFLKAQATGIDGAEEGVVRGGADTTRELADLLAAEHCGQVLFSLSAQDIEEMPIALEDMDEEKADPGSHRSASCWGTKEGGFCGAENTPEVPLR